MHISKNLLEFEMFTTN